MDSIMNPALGQQCTARDVEVASFDSYQEAKDYAFSQYWVKPVYFTCEGLSLEDKSDSASYSLNKYSLLGLSGFIMPEWSSYEV